MQNPETPPAPWFLNYHDGSGNAYKFQKASPEVDALFEYDPVTPKMSSSGIYSGGKPHHGVLEEEHVLLLWQGVRKLESETSAGKQRRVMGSGSIKYTTPERSNNFISKNGPSLREFNQYLALFRKD